MTHNPFTVSCPDCMASAGQRCRISNARVPNEDGNAVHAARLDSARLRHAVHGTCSLCGRFMVQATDPDRTFHPDLDPTTREPIPPCPPYPLPGEGPANWEPTGAEAFVRADVQPAPPEDQPNPPPPTVLPLPPGLARPGHSDPMADPPGSDV